MCVLEEREKKEREKERMGFSRGEKADETENEETFFYLLMMHILISSWNFSQLCFIEEYLQTSLHSFYWLVKNLQFIW